MCRDCVALDRNDFECGVEFKKWAVTSGKVCLLYSHAPGQSRDLGRDVAAMKQ